MGKILVSKKKGPEVGYMLGNFNFGYPMSLFLLNFKRIINFFKNNLSVKKIHPLFFFLFKQLKVNLFTVHRGAT